MNLNMFDMDEMELFYRILPDRSLTSTDPKQRMKILKNKLW